MLNKKEYLRNILIIISIVIVMLLSSCSNPEPVPNNQTDPLRIITIEDSGSFSREECSARNLEGKVIMLESKYCGACQSTIPDFREACEEKGVTPEILDLSKPEDREKMEQYNLQVRYTPTFIFGCNYYIGAESKEVYINRIEKMGSE